MTTKAGRNKVMGGSVEKSDAMMVNKREKGSPRKIKKSASREAKTIIGEVISSGRKAPKNRAKKSVEPIAGELKIEIAEIFKPLPSEAWRVKFYYGGRGGCKSYAFADSLLLLGRQKKLFIACLREIQDSIKDSVYKLLCDRISAWGLNDY